MGFCVCEGEGVESFYCDWESVSEDILKLSSLDK